MKARPLELGDVEAAAELLARQHRAAAATAPTLPTTFIDTPTVVSALGVLLDDGALGQVVTDGGRLVGVLVGRTGDGYAEMPAEGFAVDPDAADATQVLGALYAPLATGFIAEGALRHYLDHVATPALVEAVADMGFGRHHYFAVRTVGATSEARPGAVGGITVRVGTDDDLETIARLCIVEIRFRSSAPVFSPPEDPSLDDVVESHRTLHEAGATHFIAELDGEDVGVLTLEICREMPALCAVGQPFIGETGTREDARGRGVGTALVEAAVAWSAQQGFDAISVDFQPPNPLSRRFWLGAGFRPTGYGVLRAIHPAFARASADADVP